jgi:flagellar basal body-associated protein FliL
MRTPIPPTVRVGALLLAGAGLIAFASPAAATARAAAATPAVPVTVSVTERFTDTGLKVQRGATITIHAGGEVQYRSRHIRKASPDGIPWGKACRDIASQASSAPFPAPGLACWSLIGKIGADGKPFAVGRSVTFPAATSGKLFLGINDNYLPDNAGSWGVAVSGAGALPSESSSGSSNVVPLVAMVVGLALVAFLIWWVVSRRRKPAGPAKARKPAPKPKPKPAPEPEPALAAAAAVAATRTSPEARPAGAPLDPESTDVNIFRVEFVDRSTLEVGYSFFPEGTTVTWRVVQNGTPYASGEFVTEGGGSTQHRETIPLGATLAPDASSDVYFSWRIGDVPFGYNVRRDTGP